MTTPDTDTGDAWRYCDSGKLTDPAAAQVLVQAALNAFLTVRHARANVSSEEFATHIDWRRIERELQAALKVAGHPAGDAPPAGRASP